MGGGGGNSGWDFCADLIRCIAERYTLMLSLDKLLVAIDVANSRRVSSVASIGDSCVFVLKSGEFLNMFSLLLVKGGIAWGGGEGVALLWEYVCAWVLLKDSILANMHNLHGVCVNGSTGVAAISEANVIMLLYKWYLYTVVSVATVLVYN